MPLGSLDQIKKFFYLFNQKAMKLRLGIKNFNLKSIHKISDLSVEGKKCSSKKRLSTPSRDDLAIPGISLHEDVIAYPMSVGNSTRHVGGLISRKTYNLIDEAILQGNKPLQELPSFDQKKLEECFYFAENQLLYGGILYNQFGHFLLESLSRLWAYHSIGLHHLKIGFHVPWGIPDYLDNTNFVNQALRGFEIPLDRLVFLDRPVKLEQVIVPEQKYGYSYLDQPDDLFLNFIKTFKFKADLPKEFEHTNKIYVSRSKMPFASGRPIAETIFEEYLQSNGYKIFHPQFYSLYQQLTILRNAKQIIFCDGSAIHSCILLPDLEADVAVIARRREPFSANFSHTVGQFRGYGKAIDWIDAVVDQYQFGMETWDALAYVDWEKASQTLRQLGFVDTVFSSCLDQSLFIEQDLKAYIQELSDNPKFIHFMIKHKELIGE